MKPSQRDVMRRLWLRFGGDRGRTVETYAEAEAHGQVDRRSNVRNLSALEYASRLYADGIKKGWLG